ncbi:MAG: fasciclin domain-containing protein [Candidatus Eremiobacteraeota bacterium]|nr:fasciclin domain-containing protein [Candidatus Eremiobacteraeota bacterium]
MRLTRAAAFRSFAGCLLALSLTGPALAQPRAATVLELAAQQKNLNTFVAAVHTAGLDDMLKAAGPITIYAPTDEAFAKLPAAQREALMSDPARLKALLLGHVVNDMIKMRDGDSTITSGSVPSAGGGALQFGLDGERATVGGAHVISYDLRADNGCITTIDKVLLT